MPDEERSRRDVLKVAGAAAIGSIAGCSAPIGSQGTDPSPETDDSTSPTSPYTEVYRQVVDSVVLVRVYTRLGRGHGSGFVYRSGGYILTNQHVVANAARIEIRFDRGEWRTAEVVGTDVYSDLAVLRVNSPPDYVEPLDLIEEEPPVGTKVLALGNPYTFQRTVSAGIISGVNRTIQVGPTRGGFTIPDAVQTDAAVNPGNSGGPLVTLDGKVVGIIRSGGGENIGFAVSAALIRRVAPELIEDGEYEHPFMGVALTNVTPLIAQVMQLDRPRGVMVTAVLEGGPADGTLRPATGTEFVNGIEIPVGGDVIVALDGNRIDTYNDLASYLALHKRPGDLLEVTIVRGGARRTVSFRLGARPEPTSR